jgi:hypothetical protein
MSQTGQQDESDEVRFIAHDPLVPIYAGELGLRLPLTG